jgi:hypothetical protein
MAAGLSVVVTVLGSSVLASDVGTLVEFLPSTPARASEVNDNFGAVRTAVNSKLDRTVESCPVGSSIRAIAPDGTVTCETPVGDITAVNAGSGLTGGGSAGAVTLSVGNEAITSTNLAPSSVGSSEIQNGAITNVDVASGAAIAISKIAGDTGYEVGGFWSNGNVPTSITSLGSITVSAPGSGQILLFMGGTALLQNNITLNFGIGTSASSYLASQRTGIIPGSGNTTGYFPTSMVLGYSVGAAGTYTFHALADKDDVLATGNDASVSKVNLIALYVPKRY